MFSINNWADAALACFEYETVLTKRIHRDHDGQTFGRTGDIARVVDPRDGERRGIVTLVNCFGVACTIGDEDLTRIPESRYIELLRPSVQVLSDVVDRMIMTHVYESLNDYNPRLPRITINNASDNVARVSQILDNHGAPRVGRHLMQGLDSEANLVMGGGDLTAASLNFDTVAHPHEGFPNHAAIAWHRDALAFVCRPLLIDDPSIQTAVGFGNGLSIRTTTCRDIRMLALYVHCQILFGIKIFKPDWIIVLEDVE